MLVTSPLVRPQPSQSTAIDYSTHQLDGAAAAGARMNGDPVVQESGGRQIL